VSGDASRLACRRRDVKDETREDENRKYTSSDITRWRARFKSRALVRVTVQHVRLALGLGGHDVTIQKVSLTEVSLYSHTLRKPPTQHPLNRAFLRGDRQLPLGHLEQSLEDDGGLVAQSRVLKLICNPEPRRPAVWTEHARSFLRELTLDVNVLI
jgi:hypothetical protein